MIMEDSAHRAATTFSSGRAGGVPAIGDGSVALSGNGREFIFSTGSPTLIMGILNVTPDSFSDGGCFLNAESALSRALEMVREGADIIDVGGESTRPGALPVQEDEEIVRVVPVVEALAKAGILVSIDTSKAKVAKAALNAGAWMVNDVSALGDPRMIGVLNDYNAPVVLMHMRGTPETMQDNVEYADLVAEVIAYLLERIDYAAGAGIEPERIVIDPGLGFGKSASGNLLILKRLAEFKALGRPVLIGASRKSFLSPQVRGTSGEEPEGPHERLASGIAVECAAILNGAGIVRVHDVKEAVSAARISEAIRDID